MMEATTHTKAAKPEILDDIPEWADYENPRARTATFLITTPITLVVGAPPSARFVPPYRAEGAGTN